MDQNTAGPDLRSPLKVIPMISHLLYMVFLIVITAISKTLHEMTDFTGVERHMDKGMIFPFKQLCITFENIRYSVDMPKVIMIYRVNMYYPWKEIYVSERLRKSFFIFF